MSDILSTWLYLQIFYYLSIEDRLRALLQNPITSEHLFLPPPRTDPPLGVQRIVRNIWESDAWHEKITLGQGRAERDATFSTENDRRNIVLSFNLDPFQPHKRVQYSITPSVAMIMNLPENLRHRSEFLMLMSLLPGPREPKDWNTYLDFLVNELERLNRDGFMIQDPLLADDAPPTRIRVKLLNICADLPAFGHILNQQTAGAHRGCIKCHNVVSSECARIF